MLNIFGYDGRGRPGIRGQETGGKETGEDSDLVASALLKRKLMLFFGAEKKS
jgi:hypothetical protein